jgi:N-acetylglucosaminyldiphosphoundecaprenol N-acetyl-beta-D-mannosaminyltransferase
MIERVNILGVGVSAINMPMALATIQSWVIARDPHYVCVTGVHGVMESQRDQRLRALHNTAGLVTPDGMPLVWLSRLMRFRHVRRVYGPDLMLGLCAQSVARGYSHYFYGASEQTLAVLTARLTERFPGLKIVGSYAPPFRPLSAEEEQQLISIIRRDAPDILWVGLSTPKQEHWMAEHVAKLNVPVLIGVGAAFDFNAGIKRQAPVWMRQTGLEWLFRLMSEPRRLWRRYLINNAMFIYLIVRQYLRGALPQPLSV